MCLFAMSVRALFTAEISLTPLRSFTKVKVHGVLKSPSFATQPLNGIVDHESRKLKSIEELEGMSSNTPVTVNTRFSLKYNILPMGSVLPKYTSACDFDT